MGGSGGVKKRLVVTEQDIYVCVCVCVKPGMGGGSKLGTYPMTWCGSKLRGNNRPGRQGILNHSAPGYGILAMNRNFELDWSFGYVLSGFDGPFAVCRCGGLSENPAKEGRKEGMVEEVQWFLEPGVAQVF